jgi:hypothetical protein
MASRAFKNAISTIATAHAITDVVSDAFNGNPPELIRNMLERIECATDIAFGLWPGAISVKELDTIHKRILAAGTGIDDSEIVVITSMSLGLLEEMLQHLKDPAKVRAIEILHSAIMELHRHYDSGIQMNCAYERAGQAIDRWKKIQA